MSNKAFQQNLDDKKGPQPGGPYLIQMLFKEPVEMPDKEKMTAIMEKHIGSTECFCYDKKMAGFAALDHVAEFQDGKCPVQLMVMKCDKFKGKGFDAFLMSQMWDCQEDRDRIFRECKYQVVATDMDSRALECARENIYRLRLPNPVKVMQADLFPPEGLACVIVCNPPWLPARPGSPLEGAVYDEDSRMLLGFLNGLAAHLAPGGEGWLILSNFAEQLGLRKRADLLAAIKAAGLKVLGRIDAKPEHPKVADTSNPLHKARAAEVTSLWRLGAI